MTSLNLKGLKQLTFVCGVLDWVERIETLPKMYLKNQDMRWDFWWCMPLGSMLNQVPEEWVGCDDVIGKVPWGRFCPFNGKFQSSSNRAQSAWTPSRTLTVFPESQHKYLIMSSFLRRAPLSVGVVFGILNRPGYIVFLSFSLCLEVDSKRS